mmetsp:Transcript_45745/g.111519  ORF Transcript_45745/g.111519 Transcript_45745/m.111519 type:complete len:663 (+) Transcript_45745:514-2502(+)
MSSSTNSNSNAVGRVNYLIAITTSHPSSSSTAAATSASGGGSLVVIDGKSLSILSSLRSSSSDSGRSSSSSNNNSDSTSTGFSSLCPFPTHFCNTVVAAGRRGGGSGSNSISGNNNASTTTVPTLTFGGNPTKRGDTYASLVSIRCGGSSSSLPPIVHWKCRLPEADFYKAGIVVSPCGHYAVGGASSGSCYVWSTTSGRLLKTFQAHYRAVTTLCWTGNHRNSGQFLVTGGADGMVHVFSMMDLVATTEGGGGGKTRNSGSDGNSRTVPSIYTFSVHHFPVTTIVSLDGGRVASASEDGHVVVMEIFSEQVLVNIQLPHGVGCLTYHSTDGRLFAGSNRGTIYSIDMSAYAIQQTQKQGAMIAKRRRQEWQRNGVNINNSTFDEMVFGVGGGKANIDASAAAAAAVGGGSGPTTGASGDDTIASYQTDWIGHSHPVTSIELLTQDQTQLLISGDRSGCVRIWDLDARTCLKVLRPWSSSSSSINESDPSSTKKKHQNGHPVTSIQIIPQPDDVTLSRSGGSMMFGSQHSGGGSKNSGSISNLLPPLQKFASMDLAMDDTHHNLISSTAVRIPYLKPNDNIENAKYWAARTIQRKRRRKFSPPSQQSIREEEPADVDSKQAEIDKMREELEALRSQLKEKDSTIERWESVNNKLLQKLKTNN